jgi:ABC-type transport system involved in multi-copper enzyme maturation permease subunit
MKKTLIYASIVIVLIIICFGVINIYSNNTSNLENASNLVNNSDLVNSSNISNNNSNKNNLSSSTNIEANDHNSKSSTKNFKNSNNPKKDNHPKNIPKNSKLTYLQAFKIASKFAQKSKFTEDPNVKVYIKYNTYYHFGSSKDLFWDFSVYSKKNNECLAAFMVNDASGLPVMI